MDSCPNYSRVCGRWIFLRFFRDIVWHQPAVDAYYGVQLYVHVIGVMHGHHVARLCTQQIRWDYFRDGLVPKQFLQKGRYLFLATEETFSMYQKLKTVFLVNNRGNFPCSEYPTIEYRGEEEVQKTLHRSKGCLFVDGTGVARLSKHRNPNELGSRVTGNYKVHFCMLVIFSHHFQHIAWRCFIVSLLSRWFIHIAHGLTEILLNFTIPDELASSIVSTKLEIFHLVSL